MFHLIYICDNIMNLANQNAMKYVRSADHLLCDQCDTCAIRFLSYTLLTSWMIFFFISIVTCDPPDTKSQIFTPYSTSLSLMFNTKDWSIFMMVQIRRHQPSWICVRHCYWTFKALLHKWQIMLAKIKHWCQW